MKQTKRDIPSIILGIRWKNNRFFLKKAEFDFCSIDDFVRKVGKKRYTILNKEMIRDDKSHEEVPNICLQYSATLRNTSAPDSTSEGPNVKWINGIGFC
jgi:hypothetical protein